MEIQDSKNKFLDEFNKNRCKKNALTIAVKASLQHNKLYRNNIDKYKREKFRNRLEKEILSITHEYIVPKSQEDFKNDMECLKFNINKEFSHLFLDETTKDSLEPGFRISHSQKCLSVYLKHLWCMGKIPMPPLPPIDRNILKITCNKNILPQWTKVNSIEEYNVLVEYLINAAGEMHVTEWELINYPKSKDKILSNKSTKRS